MASSGLTRSSSTSSTLSAESRTSIHSGSHDSGSLSRIFRKSAASLDDHHHNAVSFCCAYRDGFKLFQGKLFLNEVSGSVLFKSLLHADIHFHIHDIQSTKKEKYLGINTSLSLETSRGEYHFSSFLHRDSCYELMQHMIANKRDDVVRTCASPRRMSSLEDIVAPDSTCILSERLEKLQESISKRKLTLSKKRDRTVFRSISSETLVESPRELTLERRVTLPISKKDSVVVSVVKPSTIVTNVQELPIREDLTVKPAPIPKKPQLVLAKDAHYRLMFFAGVCFIIANIVIIVLGIWTQNRLQKVQSDLAAF
ncbi:hypothetical protein HDU99_002107 [Rhizoclosmatium hyalinum]|nr:hypothetical protein HDU99_002107 [Rhizoclosmatium hyalinum]